MQRFGRSDLPMQCLPSGCEHAVVGHLLRQGMLEGIGGCGEAACLVEFQPPAEARARRSSSSAPQRWSGARMGTSMTAAAWSTPFSSGGSRSMRAASTACTVVGTCRFGRGAAR